MKIAAIDIGTNSTRLLIVDYQAEEYNILERDMVTTRLGEGVDKSRILSKKAIDRTLAVVKKYTDKIKNIGIRRVNIAGTSALRDVKNKDVFSRLLTEKTGHKLNIISGEREAELIYKGVSTDLEQKDYIIIDIGGGSTECIWTENNDIQLRSFDIGAVRLTERFVNRPAEPVSNSEASNIKKRVNQELSNLANKKLAAKKAIGVGGTITTLAAMELGLKEYDSELIHKYDISFNSVRQIQKDLIELPIEKRKEIAGLQPGRADIIPAGNIILTSIMEYLSYQSIRISERDILFGLIKELIK